MSTENKGKTDLLDKLAYLVNDHAEIKEMKAILLEACQFMVAGIDREARPELESEYFAGIKVIAKADPPQDEADPATGESVNEQ